ncbi:MAG: hypothetical protein ACRDT4_13435 [Micromonosporaceae bacterium]
MAGPNPRARWRRGIVLAVVATLGFGGGVAFSDTYLRPTDPSNPISMRGCVIRFDTLSSTGNSVVPRIHANSTHMCVGVTKVAVNWSGDNELVITNDTAPQAVVSVSVSPDETLTRKGISCGASGGTSVTRIYCYDRAGTFVPASSLKMYSSLSNLWVSWTMWHG